MTSASRLRLLAFTAPWLLLALGGCATAPSGSEAAPTSTGSLGEASAGGEESDDFDDLFYEEPARSPSVVAYDPLENVNRAIYAFNDKAYAYVLTPIGRGYEAVVPRPARRGVTNFFHNLSTPVRFTSALLQGKVKRAGQELGGFLVNSTVGVGGLLKPSDEIFDGPIPSEDVGQAFGVWGFKPGPYIVLPILGPTTLRDGVGRVGEHFLHPFYYIDEDKVTVPLRVLSIVNELPTISDRYEQLRDASVDPYVALRDAYLQLRQRAVEQ